MALTNCPECTKEVSTAAKTCPHCGFPLPSFRKETQPSSPLPPQRSAAQSAPAASRAPAVGAGKGCGGCLGITIIVIIVLAIIGALIPDEPNFKAGKAEGEAFHKIAQDYGRRTHSVQTHTSESAYGLAESRCPGNLQGEAREQWIKGFVEGY